MTGQDRTMKTKAEVRRLKAEVPQQTFEAEIRVREYGGAYIARGGFLTCSCTMSERHAVEGLASKLAGCPDVPFKDTGIEIREISPSRYIAIWKPEEIHY